MQTSLRFRGFEFELIPSVLALSLLLLLLSLGNWQLNRAAEKERIEQEYVARSDNDEYSLNRLDTQDLKGYLYSGLLVDGHFLGSRQYLLDNRTHKGVAGFYVITPFVLASTDKVLLVNRGWIPLHGRDVSRMNITVDDGERQIHGVLRSVPGSFVLKGAGVTEKFPRIVQELDVSKLEVQLSMKVIPYILEMNETEVDGYIREWKPFVTGKDKHRAYAVQWFLMAVVLIPLFLMFSRVMPSRAEKSKGSVK